MLQKPESVKYNRRQVLKVFGTGVGMIMMGTLTGCTPSLVRELENHKMAPLSKEDRLAQAFAKLDKKLIKQAMEEMKAVLKAYKRQTITARTIISKTRKVAERVFDHYNRIGLTSALEENAQAALQAYAGLEPEVISYLRSAEVTEEEIQNLQALCQRARNELLAAPSIYLRQVMNNIITQLKIIESNQASNITILRFEQLDFWGCLFAVLVAVGTTVATAGACAGCAAEPTKASCLGCAGGVIATIGAAGLAYKTCTS